MKSEISICWITYVKCYPIYFFGCISSPIPFFSFILILIIIRLSVNRVSESKYNNNNEHENIGRQEWAREEIPPQHKSDMRRSLIDPSTPKWNPNYSSQPVSLARHFYGKSLVSSVGLSGTRDSPHREMLCVCFSIFYRFTWLFERIFHGRPRCSTCGRLLLALAFLPRIHDLQWQWHTAPHNGICWTSDAL